MPSLPSQSASQPTSEQVRDLIVDAIIELNEELDYDHLRKPSDDTAIFDGDDSLDSLSLVSLIVDIEARVEDSFTTEVVLRARRLCR